MRAAPRVLTPGRALEREAWLAWHNKLEAWERRKVEAEREHRAFDEPRPVPPGSE